MSDESTEPKPTVAAMDGLGPLDFPEPNWPEAHLPPVDTAAVHRAGAMAKARLTPVSLVLVTFNSRDLLAEFFGSLGPAIGDREVQVTVVDNNSVDGTVEAAEALWPGVVAVRTGENLGFAAAINVGIAASPSSAHVMVLNPDVRLHHDAIDRLAAVADQPRVALVGPRLVDEHGQRQNSIMRFPKLLTPWAHLFGGARAASWGLGDSVTDPEEYRQQAWVEWVTGGAIMIARRAIDRVGPWTEDYFMYTEEVDFCRRCWDAGLKVMYEPSVSAVRRIDGEVHPGPLLYGIQAWNDYRFFRLHHDVVRSQFYRAGLFVLHLSRLPFRGPRTLQALAALVTKRSPSRQLLADRVEAIKIYRQSRNSDR